MNESAQQISQENQRLRDASSSLIAVAKEIFGETEFKYYAIPVTWRNGRKRGGGSHFTPVTGIEKYEVTEMEFNQNREQSKRDSLDAFMGRLKSSYTKYEKRISKPGWREGILEFFKQEGGAE